MDVTEALVLLQAGNWEAAHPIVQDDESALGGRRSQFRCRLISRVAV